MYKPITARTISAQTEIIIALPIMTLSLMIITETQAFTLMTAEEKEPS